MASQRRKVSFINAQGVELAGLLELPPGSPQGYALFAHCFTCGKDATSASRISRALAGRGYAVLRFDFTGLGSSDGDFANTNFSSNVEDLVAATEFLRSKYEAPKILIGHSLGGAAVLAAARHVPEAVAVITIGAPASPAHVIHNFAEHVHTIERLGVAEVNLGGRPFTIRRQFIEDMNEQRQEEVIASLHKALLIFHSPVDTTVSIADAAKIYAWARHPKSFVSLENADHLLTRPADAEYVADTLLAWVKRYLQHESKAAGGTARQASVNKGQVLVAERNHRFTRSIFTDDHQWLADEPRAISTSA